MLFFDIEVTDLPQDDVALSLKILQKSNKHPGAPLGDPPRGRLGLTWTAREVMSGRSSSTSKSSAWHGLDLTQDRTKRHLSKNVAIQVDSRCDLDEFQPLGVQSKDGAFGHIQDFLASLAGEFAAERDLFDVIHKLANTSLLANSQASLINFHFQAARGHRPAEDQSSSVLAS